MKKKIFSFVVISYFIILLLLSLNFSYGGEMEDEMINKEYLYDVISSKKVNYQNKMVLEKINNWYEYFNIEEMFLTQDGEYVDYTTYQITRNHLKNKYKDNEKKIAKNLLKYSSYPKEDNIILYEKYIEEYKKTTGEDI